MSGVLRKLDSIAAACAASSCECKISLTRSGSRELISLVANDGSRSNLICVARMVAAYAAMLSCWAALVSISSGISVVSSPKAVQLHLMQCRETGPLEGRADQRGALQLFIQQQQELLPPISGQ